jgi:hypothetical protein
VRHAPRVGLDIVRYIFFTLRFLDYLPLNLFSLSPGHCVLRYFSLPRNKRPFACLWIARTKDSASENGTIPLRKARIAFCCSWATGPQINSNQAGTGVTRVSPIPIQARIERARPKAGGARVRPRHHDFFRLAPAPEVMVSSMRGRAVASEFNLSVLPPRRQRGDGGSHLRYAGGGFRRRGDLS